MRTSEITKLVGPKLNRHLLRHWDKFLKRKTSDDDYAPDEVAFFIRVLQSSLEGISPAKAAERVGMRWFDEPVSRDILRRMALVSSELTSRQHSELLFALLQERVLSPSFTLCRGVALDRLVLAGRDLLNAESCSLFLTDRLEGNDLVLVADSKGVDEPTQLGFRIARYEHAPGWTAKVASTAEAISVVDPELDRLPDGGRPTHLKSDRHSLIAIPLIDRKRQVLGVLKAENRTPLAGMNFGVFDHSDERVLTALAATTIPLLELQRLLIRGIDLIDQTKDQLSCHRLCTSVLDAALRITSAERGEISRWDPANGLIFEVVRGENDLAEGEILESNQPSVTYGVYWDRHHRCISDLDGGRPADYLECNSKTKSEIAVPILVGDHAVGVLNAESDKRGNEGGLVESDVPILQIMAKFASLAFEMAALRDCLVSNIMDDEIEALRDEILSIANQVTNKTFRGVLYAPNYRRGCLIPRLQTEAIAPLSFHGPSLVSSVLQERRGLFSRFPERDKRVWWEGLKGFGIRGSLIGIPVALSTDVGPAVAAVVSLWNVCPENRPAERLSDEEGDEVIRACEKRIALQLRLRR